MAMTITKRKLPGEARSADEVMEDYRQYRSRLNPVLAPLLVPDPEDIYRWRVQYDCGCIEEQLATNDTVNGCWLIRTPIPSRGNAYQRGNSCARSRRESTKAPRSLSNSSSDGLTKRVQNPQTVGQLFVSPAARPTVEGFEPIVSPTCGTTFKPALLQRPGGLSPGCLSARSSIKSRNCSYR
jgi:hypothetical protein